MITFIKASTNETMDLVEVKPGVYQDGDCLITEVSLTRMGWQRV